MFCFVIRYQLNVKKNKIDDYPAKEPIKHSMQQLAACLSESFNAEDYTDQARPMSRSLIGGTINTCKTRTMSFVYTERMYQGWLTLEFLYSQIENNSSIFFIENCFIIFCLNYFVLSSIYEVDDD